MGEWVRITFWFMVGLIIGMGCTALFAHADEQWSNYPRLPKVEMTLYDDDSWGMDYGGIWYPKQSNWAPPRLTSGHWYNYNPHFNICSDSSLIQRHLTIPEFGISGAEQLIIRDTTFNGWPTNIGIEWEMIDNIFIPSDTLGPGRNIAMIQGAIQFVVGVSKPNGFCAHRVMRFYLEPHADRLAVATRQGE